MNIEFQFSEKKFSIYIRKDEINNRILMENNLLSNFTSFCVPHFHLIASFYNLKWNYGILSDAEYYFSFCKDFLMIVAGQNIHFAFKMCMGGIRNRI